MANPVFASSIHVFAIDENQLTATCVEKLTGTHDRYEEKDIFHREHRVNDRLRNTGLAVDGGLPSPSWQRVDGLWRREFQVRLKRV